MWDVTSIQPLDQHTLVSLIRNRIPAVRIEEFAHQREIEALADGLLRTACRTRSISEVTRLGISQFEQGLRASKSSYFSLARQLGPVFSKIFADSFSPTGRMIERLRQAGFDTAVMAEPNHGPYFAGTGKLRNGYSPVHVDFSPQDSEGWAIAGATAQLAWNLYLQLPGDGGELLLWDKQWQPDDDRYQVDGQYFYDDDVVQGADMLRISVSPGEVLIINSGNFHAVAEARKRLAFGSFISVFPNQRLRLWS